VTFIFTSCVEDGVDFSFRTALRESWGLVNLLQIDGRAAARELEMEDRRFQMCQRGWLEFTGHESLPFQSLGNVLCLKSPVSMASSSTCMPRIIRRRTSTLPMAMIWPRLTFERNPRRHVGSPRPSVGSGLDRTAPRGIAGELCRPATGFATVSKD
jgi:hypothetical protein